MIIPRYAVITHAICGTATNFWEKVWLIEETGEVFVDYEKFLNRYEIFGMTSRCQIMLTNSRRDFYDQARVLARDFALESI
jgi:hypothetical protein